MDEVSHVNTVLSDRTIRRHAAARAAMIFGANSEADNGDCEVLNAEDANVEVFPDDVFMDNGIEETLDDGDDGDDLSEHGDDHDVYYDAVSQDGLDHDDDNSDEEDVEEEQPSFRAQLRQWVLDSDTAHVHTNSLLKILSPYFEGLPKDSRTLLETRRTYDVQEIAGGQYHHLGIEEGIKNRMNYDKTINNSEILLVQVNIDGVPLFKSSSESFWPILGLIRQEKNPEPFVIGLWVGRSKPTDANLFLSAFVNEMMEIQRNGINTAGVHFDVGIENFICDTPARAFVKLSKGHSGYYGCDYCEQRGEYYKNRVIFPDQNAVLRTDVRFNEMANEEHHRGDSILKELNLGLVSQFPLDYMHLICLGVVKRVINLLISGPLNVRLGGNNVRILSEKLISIGRNLPREFIRKGRSIGEVERWKATEFRTFLLYTGPVALLGIVPDIVYQNFLLLFIGITILSDRNMCTQYCDYVEDLLRSFVDHFEQLYGRENLVYNIHCITHLPAHSRQFGALHVFSGFPFENYLQKIKKMVRKPKSPLSQVIRRLDERLHSKTQMKCKNTFCKKTHKKGPLPRNITQAECTQYGQLHSPDYFLSTEKPDNGVIIGNDTYIIRNIIIYEEQRKIVCQKYSTKTNFFTHPFDSGDINIFAVDNIEDTLELHSVTDILAKAVLLPFNRSFVSLPMIKSM